MSALSVKTVKNGAAIALVAVYVLDLLWTLFQGGNLLIGLLLLSAPTAVLIRLLTDKRDYSAKKALLPYGFGVLSLTSAPALVLTLIGLNEMMGNTVALLGMIVSGVGILATIACFVGSFRFDKQPLILCISSLLYVLVGTGYLALAITEAGGFTEMTAVDLSALIGYGCSVAFYLGVFLFSLRKPA